MLVTAVKALARQALVLKYPNVGLLPDVTHAREIGVHIAAAVTKQAVSDGLAQEKNIPIEKSELELWIREQMWQTEYRALRRVVKTR